MRQFQTERADGRIAPETSGGRNSGVGGRTSDYGVRPSFQRVYVRLDGEALPSERQQQDQRRDKPASQRTAEPMGRFPLGDARYTLESSTVHRCPDGLEPARRFALLQIRYVIISRPTSGLFDGQVIVVGSVADAPRIPLVGPALGGAVAADADQSGR
ncbi:hypothetical protein [Sphingomonas oryzagri]|uniref:Uncharacterized protein n=1 Tax=Sphingomonas oryzagri TaxID=3042314 RepID=A0ABT6N0J8_9SPHN|nr:hypothetical protein [Sphingomonas oryzagri]MDH7637851.1 hypothetical protein [Sphingomonas oryzagri]